VFTERTAIGLDVHARSVQAEALDTVTGEVVQARLAGELATVLDWVEGVRAVHGPVRVAYEAGPTGFGLARALAQAGIGCVVAAPSKMLRPAGDKVKTDKRDAALLVSLLRLDELVEVRVPSLAQEAARDLTRARDDARTDLMAARQRLSKLLLRQSIVYPVGKQAWTGVHDRWLRSWRRGGLGGAGIGTLHAFDTAYDTVVQAKARRDHLDQLIGQMAADSEFTAVTNRLACLRGISTLTGFALAVEIGDWHRFTGRSIASFLGLTPSEHSSGQSRILGPITRAGNAHARRLLIEAAWHHKPQYRPGPTMRARWAKAPTQAATRGDTGNRRLHHRWMRLLARNKKTTIINTAIARELAGWCWCLAVME